MLQVNLSTRPFYNERALHVALALVGLLAAISLVVGVFQLTSLTRARAILSASAERDEEAARSLAVEAETLQRQLGATDLTRVVAATGEANWLIDQRLFSWTAFFNHIERTLPPGVMLTSVRPEMEQGQVIVAIGVVGRRVVDIDRFMSELEVTGAFSEVLAREEQVTDSGTYRTLLVGRYLPIDEGGDGSGTSGKVVP